MGPKSSPKKEKSFELKVAYSEAQLKKKDSYVKVPKTLVREIGATKAEQGSWFGFHAKHYYPLVMLDSKDKIAHPSKSQMKLSIQSDLKGMHAAEIFCKPDKGGVYWFKGIRAFIFGKTKLTFSVDLPDKSVEPFTQTIKVEFDAEGRTLDEIPVEEVEEESPKKAKKEKEPAEKKRKYEKISAKEGGGAASTPEKTATGRKKKKNASLSMDIIQPLPNSSLLSGKHHLRPAGIVGLIDSCGPKGKKDVVTISGPQLIISLTPSLMHALVKDRLRVGQLASRIDKSSAGEVTRLLQEEKYLHRPTANELFLKLNNKTAHIPEGEHVLDQMRYLFEYAFENKILYSEEKKIYKHLLNSIRNGDGKFGDNFGVTYYLRFLLYMTMEADFHVPVDSDAEAAGGSASSQRTKAVSDRHSKALFSTAQQLLDNAIRDLEDSAIALFA